MTIPVTLAPDLQRILVALACHRHETKQPTEEQVHETFRCLVVVAFKQTRNGLANQINGDTKVLPALTPSEPITTGLLQTPQP